jgi:hypothetical protein
MHLLARIYVDLSHLSIDLSERIRSYLRQIKRKLDDVGDAFLHACREIYVESSHYRKFVPGQTLFQTNRCIAICITVRWFLYVVLHVENQTVTIEHLQCHHWNNPKKQISRASIRPVHVSECPYHTAHENCSNSKSQTPTFKT